MTPHERAERKEDITKVLMVVCNKDHPHYGCTGYLNGNIIRMCGTPMAEVVSENCKHMLHGFFVTAGEIKRV